MEMKLCQSCAMPLGTPEEYGTNADGSKNEEYCIYCYKDGKFGNENETLEEMIETCVPFMVKEGMSEEQARQILNDSLPRLKRWAK